MAIYFKHIRDYYCLQGFQCDNDIIKWWFDKLVEIELKEKSYDIETYSQRSADKMAAYFFALEEIVVNLSLVFCSVWYIISV